MNIRRVMRNKAKFIGGGASGTSQNMVEIFCQIRPVGRMVSINRAEGEAKTVRQWFLLSQKPRLLFPRFLLLVTGH